MSTKSSIVYDQKSGVHIYRDLLDDYVYLSIENADRHIVVRLMEYKDWCKVAR